MTTVTFYHSAICPRCRLTSVFLRSLLADYPDVTIERVEFLRQSNKARAVGIRTIPTLVAGNERLTGFLITRGKLRRFLDAASQRGPNVRPST